MRIVFMEYLDILKDQWQILTWVGAFQICLTILLAWKLRCRDQTRLDE